ncbi:FAD/NAD(P)-binding protein [Salipiger pacificus]|nr:FAD/NAD(P)-binding protein [Alloyangia pacifica]
MAFETPLRPTARGNRPVCKSTRSEGDCPAAMHRVAIIGAGPTGVYTLAALLNETRSRLHVDIFEKGPAAGPGMPYSAEMNTPSMLSNIASRELPPVVVSLNDWLLGLDRSDLGQLALRDAEIGEDAFYPRLALGAYFTAQMAELIARGRRAGHRIELHLRHTVEDIRPRLQGIEVIWRSPAGTSKADYADVVLATGHRWPDSVSEGGARLQSAWPAEKLARMPQRRIGVLGSSLSAIDVAVTVASARGRFLEVGGDLIYQPDEGQDDFLISLMSRKGLLPEADYWYQLPLPELPRLAACAAGEGPLLDRAYRAFLADLEEADGDWLTRLGGSVIGRDAFRTAYFAERLAADPFDWARENLAQAEETLAEQRPTPWRSALLRAHELFEELIPQLSESEVEAFHATLKPVFTDCYACVPHFSVRRLLALREAGVLEVLRLGEDSRMSERRTGYRVTGDDVETEVEIIIDARGQPAMKFSDLGFPSLACEDILARPLRFEDFVLPLGAATSGRIHCLALPVLLRRHPFVQGLVNAWEMGCTTAKVIAEAMDDCAAA